MSVTFYPKDKTRIKSSIVVQVTYKGERYKRSSGVSLPLKYWNYSKQQAYQADFHEGKNINAKLKKIYLNILDAAEYFDNKRRIPTATEFWNKCDEIDQGTTANKSYYLMEYVDMYIKRIQDHLAPNTIKKFITLQNKLQEYERTTGNRLDFEDIDINFYYSFKKYLTDQDYSDNYIGSLIAKLKTVYKEARDTDKLHNLYGVEHKRFVPISRASDSIYLTEEELLNIYRLEITQENLLKNFPDMDQRPQNIARRINSFELTRARFLIGAFTTLRVSDFTRVNLTNIQGNYLTITDKKTDSPVIVPLHWVIKEMIDNGLDLSETMSEQKINKQIKYIAKMAGIDTPVQTTKREGGRTITIVKEKWELITTHTARRSAITNMILRDINPMTVMKLTHKSWKSFTKYIRYNELKNAEKLKETGFFDKEKPGAESGAENDIYTG